MIHPEPMPAPTNLSAAEAILDGHRFGEIGIGFRHADRLADALRLALAHVPDPAKEAA